MAARAYLGAPTVRTPTDKGTQVEDLNTSTARKPYHWKETARLAVNRINPPYSSLRHNW
uniref:Uncharacterized protein n=1 Tax=Solanum tuberosum TaxID=4113 RepID=M1AF67_SOLTU